MNSTGYDKILVKPRQELDIANGDKEKDYYIIGRYIEWEPRIPVEKENDKNE